MSRACYAACVQAASTEFAYNWSSRANDRGQPSPPLLARALHPIHAARHPFLVVRLTRVRGDEQGDTKMNALKLDIVSAADGTVTLRLPQPGRFRVHVEATWTPIDTDRNAIFAELRHRGHPDVLRMIEEAGEDAIQRPEVLLSYGVLADDPLKRPQQPPLETREPLT
jgi:hypothetical protein